MVSALTIRTFEISGYSREDTSLFFISNWRFALLQLFFMCSCVCNNVTTFIISICQNNNDRIQVYKILREVAKMGENLYNSLRSKEMWFIKKKDGSPVGTSFLRTGSKFGIIS